MPVRHARCLVARNLGIAVLAATFVCVPRHAQSRAATTEIRVEGQRQSPLADDRPVDSGSLLGLPPRDLPATLEVIDREAIDTRGLRSVAEAAAGATGVTAGDFPAEPSAFSMRGFSGSQINTLYNGLRLGPQNMTSRVMGTGNLERIEFLKGPASLMSGEGAAGGAVNLVTRRPHRGPIESQASFSVGSFGSRQFSYGSGGSSTIRGLDYRFDYSRQSSDGFVDDTFGRQSHLSGGLDYEIDAAVRVWGAFEVKQDQSNAYWGVPLVSRAATGIAAADGLVSGAHTSSYNGTSLGAVTIDSRTFSTNYNVRDNVNEAREHFLRAGLDWRLGGGLTLRDQVYFYKARREWRNNEVIAYNADTGLVDRERFFVAHDQKLLGNRLELQWDTRPGGRENRLVAVMDAQALDFRRPGAANFPGDSVELVEPQRGVYGELIRQEQTTTIRTLAWSLENRLRLTPALTALAGLRHERIDLDRTSVNAAGVARAGFPFEVRFAPTTGRIGATYDLAPNLRWFGQYATAADVAANNLFLLGPSQRPELTRARNLETGLRHHFWEGRGQWNLSLFEAERRNLYAGQGGQTLNVAGRLRSRGVELSAAVNPDRQWQWWGNLAVTDARYEAYEFTGGSFSGHRPPNAPRFIANAGATYRLPADMPLRIGAAMRHVGDRFHSDANTVTLRAYTLFDAFVNADVGSTRVILRVRNLANRRYLAWADPFYPDQVLMGAPRSVELAAQFRY